MTVIRVIDFETTGTEPPAEVCEVGGKPWPEVEAGFLGWMLRQPTMEADLKWNAEREIARRAEGARAS